MNRYLLYFIILIFCWSCDTDKPVKVKPVVIKDTIQVDSFLVQRESEIHTYFQDLVESKQFNGVYLFAQNGKVFCSGALGYKNLKTKDTLSLTDKFQLASVSKPLTALTVLKLVEKGEISLEDSIQRFFPGFPYQNITVRLLLSHRHGLPNYMYFMDKTWRRKSNVPMKNSDVVNAFFQMSPPPYYLPNKRYNYSNSGYALLASIVEKVTKLPFETAIQTLLFDPCKMKTAEIFNLNKSDTLYKSGVRGYIRNKRLAENTYMNGVMGDKGVYCSAFDLLNLDKSLRKGFLADSLMDEILLPQHKDLREYDNYGLGFRLILDDSTNRIMWHSGWWKGFKTYYIRLIDKNVTIVVLTNRLKKFINKKELIALVEERIE